MTEPVPEKTKSFSPRACFPAFPAAFGVLIAACYALALRRDFDFEIGHFAPDSAFFHLAAFAVGISLLFSVAAGIAAGYSRACRALPEPGPVSSFGAVLGAVMCLCIFFIHTGNFSADRQAEEAAHLTSEARGVSSVTLRWAAALLGLALAAALILGLFRATRKRWFTVVLTLVGVLSVNVAMFAAYFDFAIPLNSPVRNFTTVCQGALLLFLLSEARLALADAPGELAPGFQVAACSLAASVGLGLGLGGVLFRMFAGAGSVPDPNLPLPRLALYFALGCIAEDRLFRMKLRRLTPEEREAAAKKKEEEAEKGKGEEAVEKRPE